MGLGADLRKMMTFLITIVLPTFPQKISYVLYNILTMVLKYTIISNSETAEYFGVFNNNMHTYVIHVDRYVKI